TWVIPAVIVGQVQAMVAGKVTIRDWWIDGHSAGVVGLALHEGPTAGSPVFASAERVATDLSLLGLLRGRVAPGLITLVRPEVHFRLDRNGRFANMPVFRGGAGSDSRVPSIAVEGATVCFRREGRPEMVVSGVDGRLASRPQRLDLSAGADDPTWGRWEASGRIDPSFREGSVRLEGDRFAADRAKLERIPFIPEEVWTHVVPRGPVDVLVRLDWSPGKDQPTFATRTEVTLREVDASFPTLGFDAAGTSGRLEVVDGVVHVDKVEGRAIGGKVAARGTLDFVATPSRIDLNLDLARINVADAPRSWQLYEAEVTGRLTGKVHLLAVLNPRGVDLSGSSGEAVVEDGTIQAIPVKSLTLAMHAEGDDLRYSSGPSASRARGLGRRVAGSLPPCHAGGWGWGWFGPAWTAGDLIAPTPQLPAPTSSSFGLAWAAGDLIALQPPAAPKAPAPSGTGIQFPKAITTHLELEDVDIQKLVAKAQYLTGFPFPIPISGRLSLKADATIPLGALRDVKAYAFHGDLTLTGASIDRVDFGRLESRIDLANGVLELSDLRGRLVDYPNGGPDNPPQPTGPAVAATGPLPPGGFRSNVRAELSPPGKLSVTFDGDQLPLGELAAPALPRPTPLSGLATMHLEARADLGAARRPEAWTASGQAESRQISYRGAALDRVALRFALKDSKLDVPSFAAELAGRPLSAQGGLDLKPPQAFDATLDVTGWDLAAALALVPSAPRPSPVSGAASAHAEAR
ncbi:MAG: hypothetical protein JO284_07550, partial [Planctomycetaceae bacterium]|nr:hypothetical protein [Planctomycetaceae bacterium]